MQIHEITKRQRTDEGLLDGVKDAISTAKNTAVNAVGNKGKNLVNPGTFQQAQNVSALAQADAIRQKLNKKYGFTGDKEVKGAVRSANQQGKLTPAQQVQYAAKNPETKQKVSKLAKAFDQTFDIGYELNPDAAEKYAQQKAARPVQPVQPVQPNATVQPYSSQTQQNIAAQNMQMSPQSGIKEASLAQRSQARNAPVAPVQPTQALGKKDIEQDFDAWINQQIPGIKDVPPDVDQQLDQNFKAMVTAKSQGNPEAVDAAFQKYATLALAATSSEVQSYRSMDPDASYSPQAVANQLGISTDAITKLQQRITQNHEVVRTIDTGSPTLNTLIKAIAKR
jgi:hypothetical protein